MKNIILNNLGLKLLALFLAIVTWYYIVAELEKGPLEEREALRSIFPYKLYSVQVPIKLNLIGEPYKGYAVVQNEIKIEPSTIVMVGPKALLGRVSSVETQPVDISGYTRTVNKDVSLVSPAKGIAVKGRFVNITIPIVKGKD